MPAVIVTFTARQLFELNEDVKTHCNQFKDKITDYTLVSNLFRLVISTIDSDSNQLIYVSLISKFPQLDIETETKDILPRHKSVDDLTTLM